MSSHGIEIYRENCGVIYFLVFLCFSKGSKLENSEAKCSVKPPEDNNALHEMNDE